ncbi:O-antigen ligase [Acaryochloris sp. IP29b_bin.137]|uniref:O-antigen ligase family protein n=1 Tax=Acaryochloris sp. IP29b_bin.137 TaxID=2969217 RepID=UPI00260C94CD|nr:O-antigen ligase [Acaryochloris sp. IP29b_bin.137]
MDKRQAHRTDRYFSFFEKSFSVFALVFYSSSVFFLTKFDYEVATTIEKLMYHAVTLLTVLLLSIHWRKIVPALKRLWPVLVVISFVVTSIVWSDAPGLSTQQCLPLIRCTLLGLYLGIRFNFREYLSLLSIAFIISGLLSLIFALVLPQYGVMGRGFILSGEDIKHAGSWRGIYSHKNYLGRSMVLGALCLYFTPVRQKLYLFKYLCLSILALTLLFSDSKTALVILITMFLLIPLFRAMRLEYSWMITILCISVFCAGSGATIFFDNFDQILSSLGKDSTLSGRTELWHEILLSVRDRPLFGHGYGAFWTEGGGAEMVWQEFGWQAPHAHNGTLDLLLDLGIVGTVIFLLFYLRVFCQSLLLLRQTKSFSTIFPIAFLVMLFMVNLTESSTVVRPQFAWTVFVGVSLLVQKGLRSAETVENIDQDLKCHQPEKIFV